jgi:hypothetical protein
MPGILTAFEMHLEVLQGLQKVDGFQQDIFLPEEIDLHLNREQDRLVATLFNKEFEDKQLRLDYIKNIVTKNRQLEVYVPDPNEYGYEPNMVYGVLPNDYLHLVNDRSLVTFSTAPGLCVDLGSVLTETVTERFAILPVPESSLSTGPYYKNFRLVATIGGSDVVLYTAPAVLQNQPGKEGIYSIIRNITEYNFTGYTFYWERYRDMYYPNSFIILTDNTNVSQFTFASDRQDDSPDVSITEPVQTLDYLQYDDTAVLEIASRVNTEVENRLVEADDMYELRKNVFFRTSKKEPVSSIDKGFIRIYREKNFIVTALTIDYIRRPRQISLHLNQSCELAGNAPRLIVDGCIEYIKRIIENPAYRVMQEDNITRNQNILTNG